MKQNFPYKQPFQEVLAKMPLFGTKVKYPHGQRRLSYTDIMLTDNLMMDIKNNKIFVPHALNCGKNMLFFSQIVGCPPTYGQAQDHRWGVSSNEHPKI